MITKVAFGNGFAGANYYFTQEEKMELVEARNLPPGESTMHARYMQLTAMQSDRVKNPVMTLSISWDRGDEVSQKQMFDTAHQMMQELGMGEHQYMVYQHIDTEHPHVHVMANTVHPKWEKARFVKGMYHIIDDFQRQKELANGWRFTPGRYTKAKYIKQARATPYRQKNIKVRIEKTGANRVLFDATTWKELHTQLARRGFGIEKLANGGGQIYRLDNPDDRIKASAISQQVSLGKIEKRLGQEFQPADHKKQFRERLDWTLQRAFADPEKAFAKYNRVLLGAYGKQKEPALYEKLKKEPEFFGQISDQVAYQEALESIKNYIDQRRQGQKMDRLQQSPKVAPPAEKKDRELEKLKTADAKLAESARSYHEEIQKKNKNGWTAIRLEDEIADLEWRLKQQKQNHARKERAIYRLKPALRGAYSPNPFKYIKEIGNDWGYNYIMKEMREEPERFGSLKGTTRMVIGDDQIRKNARAEARYIANNEVARIVFWENKIDEDMSPKALNDLLKENKEKLKRAQQAGPNVKVLERSKGYIKATARKILEQEKARGEIDAKQAAEQTIGRIKMIAKTIRLANPVKSTLLKIVQETVKERSRGLER